MVTDNLSIIALIFSPLIAIALLFLPFFKGNIVRIRRFSKGFMSLHFLYTVCFLAFYNPIETSVSYFKEITFFSTSWLEIIGSKMLFALDGLSILLVTLTSFIFLIALIASKNNIITKPKFYYSMMFLLLTAVLGVFCARDMFLFFLFWELELIPMYFLISHWGHGNCKKSAMKFVLYTFLGSLFMLIGILLLHFYNFAIYDNLTADFSNISISNAEFPMFMQILISILLLIGFSVKMPIVPLHTWLPDAHTDAPTPVSIVLAAILLKMGDYGIIRFNIGFLPDAFKLIAPYLVVLALINIIYCALVAYAQSDMKKIVAYSSISNMGIVLLGLCSLNMLGMSGAVFQMLAHGVISAGLFMIVGIIYLRTKTLELNDLGGLGHVMPRLMGFALIISLASIGVPLLMGFVGEFLTFLGAMNSDLEIKAVTIIALTVLILSSAYILKLMHKTFFGNIYEQWNLKGRVNDITNHEFVVLFSLIAVIVFFGIFPMSILDIVNPFLDNLLHNLAL